MRKIIDFFGFLFNKILLLVMAVCIGIFIPLMAAAAVVTDSHKVKKLVSDSKILKTIPENILYLIPYEKEGSSESLQPESRQASIYEVMDQNSALDPDKLVRAMVEVLDEHYLQSQANGLIDSVYDYAEGKTEELKFSISLASKASEMNTVMKRYLVESFATLPICSVDETARLLRSGEGGREVDILNLSCQPAGVDLGVEISRFVDELTAAGGPLHKTYTQDTLNLSSVDVSLLRFGYSSLEKLIYIGWLFIVGIGIIVIMTARNLHVGLKGVGAHYAASGITFVTVFLFLAGSLDVVGNAVQNNQSLSELQKQATIRVAEPLYDAVLKSISMQAVMYSAVLIVFGILLYILGVLAKKHKLDHLRLHHYPEVQATNTEQTPPVITQGVVQSDQHPKQLR